MVSSRQFPLLLSGDPVLQELARRLIAQRGVTTTPVVEHLDVIEQVRYRGDAAIGDSPLGGARVTISW